MAEPKVFTISRADLSQPLDSVTVVTGGIAGIGLETALLLHDLSPTNRVVILDRADIKQCKAPSSYLSSNRLLFIQCDATDWNAQRDAFDTASHRFGRIDNVFVNAGINEYGNQLFVDDKDAHGRLKAPDKRVLDIDLSSAVDTLKLAIYHMRQRPTNSRPGSIVMTASLAGYLGSAGAPLYSAAKHGLVGLLRALKNDLAKLNIAISLVAPGITLTELVAGRSPGESLHDWAKRMRAAGVPINDPGEVANAVAWLMGEGMNANGKGMLIQAGKLADVEMGIAKGRKQWMSTAMVDLFKGGRNAPLFPNKL